MADPDLIGMARRLGRVHGVLATLDGDDWTHPRHVLQDHPELYAEDLDGFLETLIGAARGAGDQPAVDSVQRILTLVRLLRKAGVDAGGLAKIAGRSDVLASPALRDLGRKAAEAERHAADGSAESLDQAVAAREAPLRHPDFTAAPAVYQAEAFDDAAALRLRRYRASRRAADLEEAISHGREALARTRDSSPMRSRYAANLSAGLLQRFELAHSSEDLDDGVRVIQQALPGCPDPSRRARLLLNLGMALSVRYRRASDADDLDGALAALSQAADELPADAATRHVVLARLGDALALRYGRSGDLGDLDKGVWACDQARASWPSRDAEWADVLYDLAWMLDRRHRRTGDPSDLDRAIAGYQESLGVPSVDASIQLLSLNNLADVLGRRSYFTGSVEDLERGIGFAREAVAHCRPGDKHWPMCLTTLGIGLQLRFELAADEADLDRAVAAFEEAVIHSPDPGTDRAARLGNLASTLRLRFLQKRSRQDVDQARQCCEEALSVLPADAPDRAQYRNNLGNVLVSRYHAGGEPADLDTAIDIFREVGRDSVPSSAEWGVAQSNLAHGLHERYRRSAAEADFSEAISAYRSCCQNPEIPPTVGLNIADTWSWWAAARGSWRETAEACRYGLEAMGRLAHTQQARAHKEAWLRKARGIPARAAYALARAGDVEEAVTALEGGRALLLTEALQGNQAHLAGLQRAGRGALATQYLQITRQLAAVEDAGRDLRESAQRQLDEVTAEIRSVRGYEHFLDPPTFAEIAAVAPAAPVVYLAASEPGGMALIVGPGPKAAAVELPGLTESVVQEKVIDHLQARIDGDPGAWAAELDAVTQWLWRAVMAPVLRAAAAATAMVLLPDSLLGLLPLSAAWREAPDAPTGRRYALDDVLITYAPSARALQEPARQADPLAALAIEDPQPTDALPLPYAGAEVTALLSAIPGTLHLSGRKATRDAVLAAMADHEILHFACHGYADVDRPLDSSLLLAHGERLTLADVLEQRLDGTRLAVLSACETAFPGLDLPDEVVSLPNGLLQAGAAGAVGSLWPVNDVTTAILMVRFYQLWRQDGFHPAEALRRAMQWVRDTTNGAKHAAFPQIAELAAPPGPPVVQAFWASARAHDHPHYWAAFTYAGR